MKTKTNACEVDVGYENAKICAKSFTIIKGDFSSCPVCCASYNVEIDGQNCSICLVGQVGLKVPGIIRR